MVTHPLGAGFPIDSVKQLSTVIRKEDTGMQHLRFIAWNRK
jgi:hypothetical protein